MKFPATMGACIDLAYRLRQERLRLEADASKKKGDEAKLKEHMLQRFRKQDLDGARGRVGTASIGKLTVAQVEDWDKLHEYIRRTREWDLLKRSVNDAAYRERLEAHKKVPGVVPFVVTKIHINKRGGR